MGISYNKLFHLLIDRNIKKGELQEMAGITGSIMARLAKNQTVKTETIEKICRALNCQPGDIMEYVETPSLQEILQTHQELYKECEIYLDKITTDEVTTLMLKHTNANGKINIEKLTRDIKILYELKTK